VDANTSQGYAYAKLIPKLPLPPIIEIDLGVLPGRWPEFCRTHRIRLYSVLAYENPLRQMKVWGASEIIRSGLLSDEYSTTNTVIDSTSGNFGEAVAWLLGEIQRRDQSFPIRYVKAVLPRSTPSAKIRRLTDRGIEVIYANDSLAAMEMARMLAEQHDWWYLQQYWNTANTAGYAPIAHHIAENYPGLGAMACGVGSGGSCSGIMPVLGEVFSNRSHRLWRVAVVVEPGGSVDGVRTEAGLKPGSLPWRRNVDDVRYIGLPESLRFSAALWRQKAVGGTWCQGGPSTGFALVGGLLALAVLEDMEKLETIRDAETGYIDFAFLVPDMRDPYEEKYAEHGIEF
jgi:cysteine synthase